MSFSIEQGKTDLVKQKYDGWHEALAKRERPGSVLSKIWYQKVIASLQDLNSKRVLEIGCGRGEFSNYLHNRFPNADITATDFSDGAIAVCQQKFPEANTLKFQVEDATALTFSDNDFDVVICCETLEHIPNVEGAVAEISRVLKPDGAFFVTTPSYFNAYALLWLKCWILNKPFESGEGIQPFEHFYTFRFILRLLNRNMLRVEEYSSSHFQWLIFPRTDPAKLRTVTFRFELFNWFFRPIGFHFFYKGTNLK